jgi:hypothetical protein
MSTTTAAERTVNRKIYEVRDLLATHARQLGLDVYTKIDNQTYYGEDGNPARIIELVADFVVYTQRSLRLSLSRPAVGRWEIDWTVFVRGRSALEGSASARTIRGLRPMLEQALEGYLAICRQT